MEPETGTRKMSTAATTKWTETEARRLIDCTLERIDTKRGAGGFLKPSWDNFVTGSAKAWKRKDIVALRVACAAYLEACNAL
jgi:hypothetical protein